MPSPSNVQRQQGGQCGRPPRAAARAQKKQVSPPLSKADQTTGLLECLSTKQRRSENNRLSFERASESTTRNSSYQAQTGTRTACARVPGQKAKGKQRARTAGLRRALPLREEAPKYRFLNSVSGTSQHHPHIQCKTGQGNKTSLYLVKTAPS